MTSPNPHAIDTDTLSGMKPLRKVVYSLILAIVLAVCQALDDATSNLGWLLAFALQAAFLWTVFLQRNRLTRDLLAGTRKRERGRTG